MTTTVLIIPGIGDSGPAHWQTLWQTGRDNFRRVRQRDWDRPERREWVAALDTAVAAVDGPLVLVAHSLGCLTVAHWAALEPRRVQGALLVAPPDPAAPTFPEAATGFAPVPAVRLGFASIVVASSNDPYAGPDRARAYARAWGSRLVDAGPLGHINAGSGLGAWPAGWALLQTLGG